MHCAAGHEIHQVARACIQGAQTGHTLGAEIDTLVAGPQIGDILALFAHHVL